MCLHTVIVKHMTYAQFDELPEVACLQTKHAVKISEIRRDIVASNKRALMYI